MSTQHALANPIARFGAFCNAEKTILEPIYEADQPRLFEAKEFSVNLFGVKCGARTFFEAKNIYMNLFESANEFCTFVKLKTTYEYVFQS